jgi:poly-beta-1,6-N-acetyl-D-glucosamine synthase
MNFDELAFWVSFILVAYPYLVYPTWLMLRARLRPRPLRRTAPVPRSISFVVAAHNEEQRLTARLSELTTLLDARKGDLVAEVIVISDGSTDGTVAAVRSFADHGVRVVELDQRQGKAVALTRGVAEAVGDVVVFGDVRQSWAPDALELLLENFADPDIGAVSGDLIVVSGPGALSGVGLYWKFEKWLRRQESRIGCQVGVTGAISAVRRELFRPIPAGTLLDDVYWPLCVALQGKRVVHDDRALAYDRLPERSRDEFRRKVRTLAGNFQLAVRLPAALVPGYSPVWFTLWSHKLSRLVVPWALLVLLVSNFLLAGWFYETVLVAQMAWYVLAVASLLTNRGGRLGGAAGSFLVLNGAAWVAFWVWISGRAGQSWGKVRYNGPVESVSRAQVEQQVS